MTIEKICELCASDCDEDWSEGLRIFLEDEEPDFLAKAEARIFSIVRFPERLPVDRRRDDPRFLKAQALIVERVLVPRSFKDRVRRFDPQKGALVPYLLTLVDYVIRESLKSPVGRVGQPDERASLPKNAAGQRHSADFEYFETLWTYFAKLSQIQRVVLMLRAWGRNALPRSWRCRVLKDIFAVARDKNRRDGTVVSCVALRDCWRMTLPQNSQPNERQPGEKGKVRRSPEEYSGVLRARFLTKMAKADGFRTAKLKALQRLSAGMQPDCREHRLLVEELVSQCQRIIQENRADRIEEVFPVDEGDVAGRQRLRLMKACFREMKSLQSAQKAYGKWKQKRKGLAVPDDQLSVITGKPKGTISGAASTAAKKLRRLAGNQTDEGRILAEVFADSEADVSIADLFGAPGQAADDWIRERVCQLD